MSPSSFKRAVTSLCLFALLAACSGSTTGIGGMTDAGNGGDGSHDQDSGNPGDGGGCGGRVPGCYPLDSRGCCVNTPYPATCVNGSWSCGSGTMTCLACSDAGSGDANDVDASCGPPPPGPCICGQIQCINGAWVCPDPSTCVDGGGADCSATPCPPGDVCVVQNDTGGPCLLSDGGACPPGYMLQGMCCVLNSTTYTCMPLPSGCNGVPSCGCAAQLCQCMCTGASGNDLDCMCAFP